MVAAMSWTSRAREIKVGDRVCYSRRFLQSTGQFTGNIPHARGVVTALVELGGTTLAEIDWSDDETPARVNVANLTRITAKGIIE